EGPPRNVWAGTADTLDVVGDRVRVRVAGPVPIVAEITPAAASELRLADGGPGWASGTATGAAVSPAYPEGAAHATGHRPVTGPDRAPADRACPDRSPAPGGHPDPDPPQPRRARPARAPGAVRRRPGRAGGVRLRPPDLLPGPGLGGRRARHPALHRRPAPPGPVPAPGDRRAGRGVRHPRPRPPQLPRPQPGPGARRPRQRGRLRRRRPA